MLIVTLFSVGRSLFLCTAACRIGVYCSDCCIVRLYKCLMARAKYRNWSCFWLPLDFFVCFSLAAGNFPCSESCQAAILSACIAPGAFSSQSFPSGLVRGEDRRRGRGGLVAQRGHRHLSLSKQGALHLTPGTKWGPLPIGKGQNLSGLSAKKMCRWSGVYVTVHKGICRKMGFMRPSAFSTHLKYIWGLGGCSGFDFCCIKRKLLVMGLHLQVVLSINEGRGCLFPSQTHAAGSCITLYIDLHPQFNWLIARVRRRHQTRATVQIKAVVAQKLVVATPCVMPYVSFIKCSSPFLRSSNKSIACSRLSFPKEKPFSLFCVQLWVLLS